VGHGLGGSLAQVFQYGPAGIALVRDSLLRDNQRFAVPEPKPNALKTGCAQAYPKCSHNLPPGCMIQQDMADGQGGIKQPFLWRKFEPVCGAMITSIFPEFRRILPNPAKPETELVSGSL